MDVNKRWSGAFGFRLDENLEYAKVQVQDADLD